MNIALILRHMLGYAVGLSLFFVLIPWGLYRISIEADPLLGCGFIGGESARIILAIIIVIPGAVFAIWSNAALLFIGKGGPADGFGVAISPRTKHLVIRGPYRFSRNPMVFGALSCYFSLGVFLDSPTVIIVLLIFIPMTVVYLKNTEEKRLERDFGEEYREYRRRVSMVVPLPPRGN